MPGPSLQSLANELTFTVPPRFCPTLLLVCWRSIIALSNSSSPFLTFFFTLTNPFLPFLSFESTRICADREIVRDEQHSNSRWYGPLHCLWRSNDDGCNPHLPWIDRVPAWNEATCKCKKATKDRFATWRFGRWRWDSIRELIFQWCLVVPRYGLGCLVLAVLGVPFCRQEIYQLSHDDILFVNWMFRCGENWSDVYQKAGTCQSCQGTHRKVQIDIVKERKT